MYNLYQLTHNTLLQHMSDTVHNGAYGWEQPRISRFIPSTHDEPARSTPHGRLLRERDTLQASLVTRNTTPHSCSNS